MLNSSKIVKVNSSDVQHATTVDMQLHRMESYINPDVHNVLSFKASHAEMVGDTNIKSFPEPDGESTSESENALGVALIQPVTTGLEFCEIRRELFPTKRTVFINIEPVSTLLSFEDLNLIETVLARLSSAQTSKKTDGIQSKFHDSAHGTTLKETTRPVRGNSNHYEIVFSTPRLGLGLKTEKGRTVVNSIQNSELQEVIHPGDTLVSIEKENVRPSHWKMLSSDCPLSNDQ